MDNFLRSEIKIKEVESKVEEKVKLEKTNESVNESNTTKVSIHRDNPFIHFLPSQIKIKEVEPKAEEKVKVEKTNESVNESNTTNVSEPEINDDQSPSSNTGINESQQASSFTLASHEKSIDLDNEKLKILTNVCSAAMVTPRCIKRITNCYKILKYIWFEMNQMNQPNMKICKACLTLLCLSASTTVEIQNDLKKSFCWLERGIKEKQETFWKFLEKNIFVDDRLDDWPNACYEIAEKYFSIDWKEFEDNFWLARSFTFVGDFVEDENIASSGKILKPENLKQMMEDTMKEKFDTNSKQMQTLIDELKSDNLKQMRDIIKEINQRKNKKEKSRFAR